MASIGKIQKSLITLSIAQPYPPPVINRLQTPYPSGDYVICEWSLIPLME